MLSLSFFPDGKDTHREMVLIEQSFNQLLGFQVCSQFLFLLLEKSVLKGYTFNQVVCVKFHLVGWSIFPFQLHRHILIPPLVSNMTPRCSSSTTWLAASQHCFKRQQIAQRVHLLYFFPESIGQPPQHTAAPPDITCLLLRREKISGKKWKWRKWNKSPH